VDIRAAGFFEGVGEDGEADRVEDSGRKGTLVVSGPCYRQDGVRSPGRVEGSAPERVAHNVAEQVALRLELRGPDGVPPTPPRRGGEMPGVNRRPVDGRGR